MKVNMNKKNVLILTILLAAIHTEVPALALVSDPTVYSQLKDRRWELVTKESKLIRDKDSIERNIDELNRRNKNNKFDSTLNSLTKDLDKTFQDLRKVRLDIQEVDTALSS
ncbi:MAG: hypothetical protein K2Z81_18620 [Cyanobacteria bacterium]|nr:hypothetical protein [Cyanobacteriota bacterium]